MPKELAVTAYEIRKLANNTSSSTADVDHIQILEEAIKAINAKVRQCARDFGMHNFFQFAIFGQYKIVPEIADQLKEIYRDAGWGSLDLVSVEEPRWPQEDGTNISGYRYIFSIRAYTLPANVK